jgi:hypothetical protein
MTGRGMTKNQLKDLLRSFNDAVREKVKDPDNKEVRFDTLKHFISACRFDNTKHEILDTPQNKTTDIDANFDF